MPRTSRLVPTMIALAVLAAACSGSGGDQDAVANSSTSSQDSRQDADRKPGLVDKPDDTGPTTDSQSDQTAVGDDAAQSSESVTVAPPIVTTVLPTVPAVGVPGIDSDDLFCRSWSEFAGTYQALALASTFASPDLSAQRSEVVASGVIIAAAAGLGESLPTGLEEERDALTVGFVGPMERRALRASSALETAGLTTRQIDELSEIWLAALIVAGVDAPNIQLDIPEDVALLVDGVVEEFSVSVPLIREDPSLITDASIPMVEAYIVDNCPDGGTLRGNDVIQQS